jgi:hypothetical protein
VSCLSCQSCHFCLPFSLVATLHPRYLLCASVHLSDLAAYTAHTAPALHILHSTCRSPEHLSCPTPCLQSFAHCWRGSCELRTSPVPVAMDERESSVASSTDFYGSEAVNIVHSDMAATKRKAEDESSARDKKRKLASPSALVSSDLRRCAGLPPAVWQHIFLFCSLADLGRLMQVNRLFLSYLTDVHNVSVSKPDSVCLRLLKSESIWASARNALSPRPPKPLQGFTELQMWQLAWGRDCQFCSTSSSFTPGEKIWQKGPGTTGVRTIWPFGIRACGPCLLQQCQTVSRPCLAIGLRLTFAGNKPSVFGCVRTSTRAPFCTHYQRPQLHCCARSAVNHNTTRRGDWQILLQETCRGNYTGTQ